MSNRIYSNIKTANIPECKFPIISHAPEILINMLGVIEWARIEIGKHEHYEVL